MKKKTKKVEHLFIPDGQVKPGVNTDHWEALGNYVAARKPDVIVNIGDFADMPSLSDYDRPGSHEAEGRRYVDDIDAAWEAMHRFLKPVNKVKGYKPRMVLTIGNHEERIARAVAQDPAHFEGVISYDDLPYTALGWDVYDFLVPVRIDGITYSHYFYQPKTGRPYTGTALSKLKNIGFSFSMGHQQGIDIAIRELGNGTRQIGLVAGSFYSHNEKYRGPQATNEYRGVVYKHEVKNGQYDPMFLSLDYLVQEWL